MALQKGIVANALRWPLLWVEYANVIDDRDMEKHVAELKEYYIGRRQKFAVVYDLGNLSSSAKQRKMMADFLAAHHEEIGKWNLGVGFHGLMRQAKHNGHDADGSGRRGHGRAR